MAFDIIHPMYPQRAFNGTAVIASQSLTVSTASVSFATAYDVNYVRTVSLDIQGVDVRVRFDGTDPTGTVGHILPAGTAYCWDVDRFNNAEFIRISTASTDATIFASPNG